MVSFATIQPYPCFAKATTENALRNSVTVEGDHNIPSQNMPLWHTTYFLADKKNEKQQMQEKLWTFPF